MIEITRPPASSLVSQLPIKVVGLGGAGINALDRIQLDSLDGAEIIAINTDAQSLAGCVAPVKVQIGRNATRGLGAGGDPEIGYAAADESLEDVRAVFDGGALIFLCVGLGGGTGSGAAPLLANLARQQNALVIAFATLPFTFEGRRRMAQAEEALASLQQQADVVICFENDKMGDAVSPRAGIQDAFSAADQTLSQSVRAIAALLQRRGLIHVGFDELTSALRAQHPRALFGFGEADGDNRAHTALERALRSPLMDRGRLLADAASVLVHVAGGPAMTLNEVQILMEELNRHISDSTRVLFSTAVDPRLGAKMNVTLLSALAGEIPAQLAPPLRVEAIVPAPTPPPVRERIRRAKPEPAPLPEPTGEPEPEPMEVEPVFAATASPVVSAAPLPPEPASPQPKPMPKTNGKPRTAKEEKQEQMQFEPVTRGRFEKSEPTIVDGQDLDVPTFLRQNVRVK